MARARIATLLIQLTADNAKLRGDLQKANRSINQFSKNTDRQLTGLAAKFSKTGAILKSAFVGFGAGAAGAITLGLIKRTFEWANALQDSADKIGVTTESLQQLTFAASGFGINAKTSEMALQRFARRAGEAANGTGELVKTLKKYGIEVLDTQNRMRDLDDILDDFADAVQNAGSAQEQLAMVFKAMDSEGAKWVNVLRHGSEGMDEFRQRAIDLGAVLDDETIAAAAEANSEFDQMAVVLGTQLSGAMLNFTPIVTGLGQGMAGLAGYTNNLTSALGSAWTEFSRWTAPGFVDVPAQKSIVQLTSDLNVLREMMSGPGDDFLAAIGVIDREQIQRQIDALEMLIGTRKLVAERMRNGPRLPITPAAPGTATPGTATRPDETLKMLESRESDGQTGIAFEALENHRQLVASLQSEIDLRGMLSEQAQTSFRIRQQETELIKQRQALIESGVEASVIDAEIQALQEKRAVIQEIDRDDAVARTTTELREQIVLQRQSISLLTMDEAGRRAVLDAQQEITDLQERYGELLPEQKAEIEALYDEAADVERIKESLEELRTFAESLGSAVGNSFADMVTGAQSFEDALKSLERQLLNIMAQQFIVGPISQGFGNIAVGGATAGSDGEGSGLDGILPFHEGGTVDRGVHFRGMANDERWIKAELGEFVLSRDMLRSFDGIGHSIMTAAQSVETNSNTYNYSMNFSGGRDRGDTFGTTPRQMMDALRRAEPRDGRFR